MFFLFIAAVCGLNIYDWWKLRNAFLRGHLGWAIALLAVILTTLFLPFIMRKTFQPGMEPRFLEQASWIWLALSFWLFSAFILLDAWNLGETIVWAIRSFRASAAPEALANASRWRIPPAAAAYSAMAFTAVAVTWGLIEAAAIRTKHLEITTPFAPAPGFKIVLISDIHIGPAATDSRLAKTIALVNNEKPDIVLSAGDFIDGSTQRERRMAAEMTKISMPANRKIAVLGNHDVYSGLKTSRELHALAGFTLMEDKDVLVDDWLWIYGESDPASGRHPGAKPAAVKTPPVPPKTNTFNILLKHRPDPIKDTATPFNLQLSGHSHGGQIFPFNFMVKLQYKYSAGKLHTLPNNSRLYISPGTGLWGPPFRVFARPEITVITFKNK